MRGSLLGYDAARGEGVISASDEQRYKFAGTEWKGDIGRIRAGMQVDFEASDGAALQVYPVSGASSFDLARVTGGGRYSPPAVAKSHVTAGVLALLFGGLGIHKFYMGYDKQGWILLGSTVLSYILVVVVIGIFGLFTIGVICLAEAIILFTKDQDDFEQTYLSGGHPWF